MDFDKTMFTATDVKHYAYCPVIIYIKYVLGLREHTTEYMEMGREIHEDKIIAPVIAKYKPTRVLRNPYLVCRRYSISGVPDYLLLSRFNYGVVVEVKWAEPARYGVKRDHKLQLGAYALTAKCSMNINVRVGVIYYLRPEPKLYEVKITGSLIGEVVGIIREMRDIIGRGYPPEPRFSARRCLSCNYRSICPSARRPPQTPHHS